LRVFLIGCGTNEQGSAMKRILDWADWVVSPSAWIASIIGIATDGLSKDYRDDPVYKKNVKRLIERNSKPEDTKE
jgi:hypothetical protein